MILSLVFFLLGFLVSFLMTPWVIRLAYRGVGLDEPNENRKRHDHAIPRLGGMPIMLSVSLGLLLILLQSPQHATEWVPVLLGSVMMFSLGLWDDLTPLGARKKLAGQIAIAGLVYAMGLKIELVTYPGARWSVHLGQTWSIAATILWLIAVPNIVNLIDGFDGVASGLGMFMAVTLGIVGIASEQLAVAWYAFTLAGALLGFLVFNFPPARIFLGDGGAYLIGFCIAALSLTSSHKGSIAAVLLVTIVALGVPIIDTTFAMIRRALRGFPLFRADDEHIHHRLQNLGFSQRRIVFGMYGVCLVFSLCGLSIFWSQGRTIPIAIGAVLVLAIFGVRFLEYVKAWADVRGQIERVLGRRRSVQYALLQAQILDMEIDRCEDAEEFWMIFRHTLERVGFIENIDGMTDRFLAIHIKYNGNSPWTLHAPEGAGTPEELQRIAECFRPVYTQGAREVDKSGVDAEKAVELIVGAYVFASKRKPV